MFNSSRRRRIWRALPQPTAHCPYDLVSTCKNWCQPSFGCPVAPKPPGTLHSDELPDSNTSDLRMLGTREFILCIYIYTYTYRHTSIERGRICIYIYMNRAYKTRPAHTALENAIKGPHYVGQPMLHGFSCKFDRSVASPCRTRSDTCPAWKGPDISFWNGSLCPGILNRGRRSPMSKCDYCPGQVPLQAIHEVPAPLSKRIG